MIPENATLVRETVWLRVYRVSNTELRYVSRFIDDNLEISHSSLIQRWPAMSTSEQLDFSLAFSAKPDVSDEDMALIEFLMETADADVCSNIAVMVTRAADKRRATALLVRKIDRQRSSLANYLQALGLIKDREALTALREYYDRYRGLLNNAEVSTLRDYAHCCRALLAAEGDELYRRSLVDLSASRDEGVSSLARQLLKSG